MMCSALRFIRPLRRIARPGSAPSIAQAWRPSSVGRSASTYREQPDLGIQSAASHFKRQRHLPYFLEYLMWVVFGSEALHLIWLKMEYNEYKETSRHKIALLTEIVKRVEAGEQVDDNLREEIRMVLLGRKRADDDIDDDYLNKLISSSEEVEQIQETPAETMAPPNDTPSSDSPPSDAPAKKKFYL